MDTTSLIADAKARFNHNSAKAYLKEKYDNKLIVADQGGLWKADQQIISFLNSFKDKEIIIIDTFNNPVKVKRIELLNTLQKTYNQVMTDYFDEWKELEGKR